MEEQINMQQKKPDGTGMKTSASVPQSIKSIPLSEIKSIPIKQTPLNQKNQLLRQKKKR